MIAARLEESLTSGAQHDRWPQIAAHLNSEPR